MIPVIVNSTEFSSKFYFIDDKLQPRSFSHTEILPLISPTEIKNELYDHSVKVAGKMYGLQVVKRRGKFNKDKWKHNIKSVKIALLEEEEIKSKYPLIKI